MMKWYPPRGKYSFRPNYIVQYPDITGTDRSVPFQFKDIAEDLVRLPSCKIKGFWKVKWKDCEYEINSKPTID